MKVLAPGTKLSAVYPAGGGAGYSTTHGTAQTIEVVEAHGGGLWAYVTSTDRHGREASPVLVNLSHVAEVVL